MFASQVRAEVKVGDETVVIRKLSARSLEKAAEVRQGSIAATARTFGPEMIQAFRKPTAPVAGTDSAPIAAAAATTEATLDARYLAYDRHTVLVAGVVSWTANVTMREGLEDLDEEAAEKLFRAIIDLSVLTPEAAEATRKNV